MSCERNFFSTTSSKKTRKLKTIVQNLGGKYLRSPFPKIWDLVFRRISLKLYVHQKVNLQEV